MSYKQALDDLLSLEYFGMKLGLRNIEELLEYLGNPERTFKAIHVAGTNGKGSVCATLAAYYQTKGLKTGLFTSPHLLDYRERIRIDGAMIPETAIEQFVEKCWPKVKELNATFFEVTTALAFDHFANEGVDIAIVETGLGGRLDATNVLEKPIATVVTSIGFDHMQQLGNTIEEIAAEKAGIAKPGVPLIVNVTPDLFPVFEKRCAEAGCSLIDVVTHQLPSWADDLTPEFAGEHQRKNLQTALVTLDTIGDLDEFTMGKTLGNVSALTGLRGRLEKQEIEFEGKRITRILDVGHNEAALREIARYLKALDEKVVLLAGFMKDKDVSSALNLLAPHVQQFIAVQPKTSRAMTSRELAAIGQENGIPSFDGGDVVSGSRQALLTVEEGSMLLVIGSHYLIGEILANEKSLSGVL